MGNSLWLITILREQPWIGLVFGLVLRQGSFHGLSAAVVSRNKAQHEGNGLSPCQVL